MTELWIDKK